MQEKNCYNINKNLLKGLKDQTIKFGLDCYDELHASFTR